MRILLPERTQRRRKNSTANSPQAKDASLPESVLAKVLAAVAHDPHHGSGFLLAGRQGGIPDEIVPRIYPVQLGRVARESLDDLPQPFQGWEIFLPPTQGSSFVATLGFGPESFQDSLPARGPLRPFVCTFRQAVSSACLRRRRCC